MHHNLFSMGLDEKLTTGGKAGAETQETRR